MQADKFGSFSSTVSSAQEFIDLGMGDESVEEIVTWLKQRKGELEKYHTVMLRVNNSFNFATSLKPTPFSPHSDFAQFGHFARVVVIVCINSDMMHSVYTLQCGKYPWHACVSTRINFTSINTPAHALPASKS